MPVCRGHAGPLEQDDNWDDLRARGREVRVGGGDGDDRVGGRTAGGGRCLRFVGDGSGGRVFGCAWRSLLSVHSAFEDCDEPHTGVEARSVEGDEGGCPRGAQS